MRFFALFCLMISMAFGQNVGDLCAVALRVVDVGGRPLPYKVSSFKNARGAEYVSAFEGLRGQSPTSQPRCFAVCGRSRNNLARSSAPATRGFLVVVQRTGERLCRAFRTLVTERRSVWLSARSRLLREGHQRRCPGFGAKNSAFFCDNTDYAVARFTSY